MKSENEKIQLKQWNFAKLQRFQHQNDAASIRLGMKTWDNDLLRGTIYDERTLPGDYLGLYASQYDAVEVHDTFRDPPTPYDTDRLKRKVEKVNPNFRFCPVVPRIISHETNLSTETKHLTNFLYALEGFDLHLGSCILQLPETFSPTSMPLLKNFLAQWPLELRLMIDFRHKHWFLQKNAFAELMQKNIGVLITDDIGLEKRFERFVTGDNLGVRFIGRSKLESDDQRLALWVYRMNEFGAMGIKDSYLFLYEQPEMCLGLLQKVANSIGGITKVPLGYDTSSDQLSLF